jgi:hypothetical protein
MNAATQPDDARVELINEALYDAICDGDGRPHPDALAHHLAKRGLVIVEASRLERLTVAIQLIGSAAAALVGTESATIGKLGTATHPARMD